jgi:hypothetical protein
VARTDEPDVEIACKRSSLRLRITRKCNIIIHLNETLYKCRQELMDFHFMGDKLQVVVS